MFSKPDINIYVDSKDADGIYLFEIASVNSYKKRILYKEELVNSLEIKDKLPKYSKLYSVFNTIKRDQEGEPYLTKTIQCGVKRNNKVWSYTYNYKGKIPDYVLTKVMIENPDAYREILDYLQSNHLIN